MRIIDFGKKVINIDIIAQVQLNKLYEQPYTLEIRFVNPSVEENESLTLPKADTREHTELFATHIMDDIVNFLADTDKSNTMLDLTQSHIEQEFMRWVNEGTLKPYKREPTNDYLV